MVRTKKIYCQFFLFRNHSRSLLLYYVCITMLTWCNRWMVSFVDTICHVSKIIWRKISNLMILDNYAIDYSQMLLFVFGFLVHRKIEPNSRASGNTGFTNWLQSGHVKVVKKTKCNVKDNNFSGFIKINTIFTPFFNWKIAAILFIRVIDYYWCIIIQQNWLTNSQPFDFGSKVFL